MLPLFLKLNYNTLFLYVMQTLQTKIFVMHWQMKKISEDKYTFFLFVSYISYPINILFKCKFCTNTAGG